MNQSVCQSAVQSVHHMCTKVVIPLQTQSVDQQLQSCCDSEAWCVVHYSMLTYKEGIAVQIAKVLSY
jgi:hypothetical protein